MRTLMIVLACCLAFPAWADETPEEQKYREYVETRSAAQKGICTQVCSTTLATCQAGGGLRCSRYYQSCLDDCDKPRGKPKLSKKDERLRICQQRCDHSASTCAAARPNDPSDCDRGRLQCYGRCGP